MPPPPDLTLDMGHKPERGDLGKKCGRNLLGRCVEEAHTTKYKEIPPGHSFCTNLLVLINIFGIGYSYSYS